ncbi:MAG TPA: ABC transporter family substrate-binding protein [Jatrophihabitantaceae bacterium]
MKVRTRGAAVAVTALVVALGVTACTSSGSGGNGGGTGGNNPTTPPGNTSPAPVVSTNSQGHTTGLTPQDINAQPVSALKQGGTLVWGLDQFSTQWNYNQVNGPESSTANVINALMPDTFLSDAQANLAPDPNYVESATQTKTSPQTIEYKLNPKAKWSDGKPITEADWEAEWKALNGSNKAYQVASSTGYDQIASVKQGSDKYDVIVTFSKPFTDWKALFAPLYPAAYNSDPTKFNKGYLNAIPVTAGPFGNPQFNKSAQTVTVTPDPKWWGNKPLLSKIVFKAEESTAANQAFVNGEIDYDFDVAVDPADYKQIKQASNGHVTLAAGPDYRQFTFNGTHGFMKDEKVRQAIMLGTSRDALIKSDLNGIPWPTIPLDNHFFMNSQAGYQDNTGDLGTYDLNKAKSMLTADGFTMNGDYFSKGGKTLEIGFTIPAGIQSSKNEGELFQAMMKQAGVKVDIKTVPSNDFFDKYIIPGNFDVSPFSWLGTPFPISSSLSIYASPKAGGGQNFTGVSNPQVDTLLKQAISSTDPQQAVSLTNQADKLLYQQVHTLTLFQRPQMCGVKNGLANLGSFGFATIDYTKIGYTKNS